MPIHVRHGVHITDRDALYRVRRLHFVWRFRRCLYEFFPCISTCWGVPFYKVHVGGRPNREYLPGLLYYSHTTLFIYFKYQHDVCYCNRDIILFFIVTEVQAPSRFSFQCSPTSIAISTSFMGAQPFENVRTAQATPTSISMLAWASSEVPSFQLSFRHCCCAVTMVKLLISCLPVYPVHWAEMRRWRG